MSIEEINIRGALRTGPGRQYVLISVTIGLEKKSQIKTSPFPKHLLFKIESPFLVYLKANWNSILAMQF